MGTLMTPATPVFRICGSGGISASEQHNQSSLCSYSNRKHYSYSPQVSTCEDAVRSDFYWLNFEGEIELGKCCANALGSNSDLKSLPSHLQSPTLRGIYLPVGFSSMTGDWDSKFDDTHVDQVESTVKGRQLGICWGGCLNIQKGNFDAALQVFQGIDIRDLNPRMIKAISERTKQRKLRSNTGSVLPNVMSTHSAACFLRLFCSKQNWRNSDVTLALLGFICLYVVLIYLHQLNVAILHVGSIVSSFDQVDLLEGLPHMEHQLCQ